MIILIPLSLTNTMLLLWLAVTVPLNAARRTAGVWLATLGLLGGGLFFARHTLLVANGYAAGIGLVQTLDREVLTLWKIGWLAVVLLPLGWHLMLLWHRNNRLHIGRVGLLIFSLWALIMLATTVTITDIVPILYPRTIQFSAFWTYIPYVIGLTALNVWHALQQMRQHAADRWLFGTAVSMHLVSWVVSVALLGVLIGLFPQQFDSVRGPAILFDIDYPIVLADGVVLALLTLGIFCLGQALAVNEAFAERPLPRYGLQREWRRMVILAIGFSAVITIPLALRAPAMIAVLISVAIMVAFHALSTWRALGEQERFIDRLRQFIGTAAPINFAQAATIPPANTSALRIFAHDILQTAHVDVIPLGNAATLLTTPDTTVIAPATLAQLATQPIVPVSIAPFAWAVGLYAESARIGVLLLGERMHGAQYTAEEIQLARAVGEQRLNQQMTAEIARRLVLLQREHLTQQRLHDPRVRRLLHDDVLPTLQAALVEFSSGDTALGMQTLTHVHQQISALLRQIPIDVVPDLAEQGLIATLKDLLERDFQDVFETVQWAVSDAALLSQLPAHVIEILYFALREGLRNASKYGGPNIEIGAKQDEQTLTLWLLDDGTQRARPSTGATAGLALNSTLLAVVGGQLQLQTLANPATRLEITVPLSTMPTQ